MGFVYIPSNVQGKVFYTERFGNVTLNQVGEKTYQVYDAVDDTYRGTIEVSFQVTEEIINNKLDLLYAFEEKSTTIFCG